MAARNIGSNAMFPPPPAGRRTSSAPPIAEVRYAQSSSGTSFIGSFFGGRRPPIPPPAESDYATSYAGGSSYQGSDHDGSSGSDNDSYVSSLEDENKPQKLKNNKGQGYPDYDSDGNSIEEFEVIGDKNLNAFARQLEYQRDPYRYICILHIFVQKYIHSSMYTIIIIIIITSSVYFLTYHITYRSHEQQQAQAPVSILKRGAHHR